MRSNFGNLRIHGDKLVLRHDPTTTASYTDLRLLLLHILLLGIVLLVMRSGLLIAQQLLINFLNFTYGLVHFPILTVELNYISSRRLVASGIRSRILSGVPLLYGVALGVSCLRLLDEVQALLDFGDLVSLGLLNLVLVKLLVLLTDQVALALVGLLLIETFLGSVVTA